MSLKHLIPLILASLAAPMTTSAENQRQLDAHEHGHAELNLALEGKQLFIELYVPALNIVGFEHAPETDEQKGRIAAETEQLADASALFVLVEEAGCTVDLAEASLSQETDHEGHDEQEEHTEDPTDDHAEFTATYEFLCSNPEALDEIVVRLFTLYPGIERIEVAGSLPSTQISQALDASSPIIRFP